jgi:hypothetical protein
LSRNSASAPAISTPVAPPPTTSTVNRPDPAGESGPGSEWLAMVSSPPKIVSRTRSASARVYIDIE